MYRLPMNEREARAIQASPNNRRKLELQAQAEKTRQELEAEQRKAEEAFREWEHCDRFLNFLEDLRDRYAPKTPDEPWNNMFCMAIEMIPEYRAEARELWLNYATSMNL